MNDTENNPQQPPDDDQPSGATSETTEETSDGRAPADSDPPIIVHDTGGPGNP